MNNSRNNIGGNNYTGVFGIDANNKTFSNFDNNPTPSSSDISVFDLMGEFDSISSSSTNSNSQSNNSIDSNLQLDSSVQSSMSKMPAMESYVEENQTTSTSSGILWDDSVVEPNHNQIQMTDYNSTQNVQDNINQSSSSSYVINNNELSSTNSSNLDNSVNAGSYTSVSESIPYQYPTYNNNNLTSVNSITTGNAFDNNEQKPDSFSYDISSQSSSYADNNTLANSFNSNYVNDNSNLVNSSGANTQNSVVLDSSNTTNNVETSVNSDVKTVSSPVSPDNSVFNGSTMQTPPSQVGNATLNTNDSNSLNSVNIFDGSTTQNGGVNVSNGVVNSVETNSNTSNSIPIPTPTIGNIFDNNTGNSDAGTIFNQSNAASTSNTNIFNSQATNEMQSQNTINQNANTMQANNSNVSSSNDASNTQIKNNTINNSNVKAKKEKKKGKGSKIILIIIIIFIILGIILGSLFLIYKMKFQKSEVYCTHSDYSSEKYLVDEAMVMNFKGRDLVDASFTQTYIFLDDYLDFKDSYIEEIKNQYDGNNYNVSYIETEDGFSSEIALSKKDLKNWTESKDDNITKDKIIKELTNANYTCD